ncbi:MAG: acyltransferase family protein [Reyranellaceae bacterium]
MAEPENSPAVDRVAMLDILKALAICLVVFGHVVQGFGRLEIVHEGNALDALQGWVYRFHMHSFFFASGCALALRPPESFTALLARRACTLYWPHLVWSAIYYAVAVIFVRYYNSPMEDPGDIGRHVLEIVTGQKSWFLVTLFVVTLAAWPLLKRARFLTLAIALALAALPLFGGWQVPHYFQRFAVFLVLGFAAVDLVRRTEARSSTVALAAAGVTLLAAILPATPPSSLAGTGLRLWDLMSGCLGVAGLLAVAAALSRTALMSVLSWLGNASLAIFLMHPLASGAARIATLKLLPHDGFLQVGIVTFAGIALPALAYAVALRLGMNWLFAFPRRRPQASYPASPAL